MRLYLCIQPSLRPSIHLCILVIHYTSLSFTYAKNLTLFDNHFAIDLCQNRHCAIAIAGGLSTESLPLGNVPAEFHGSPARVEAPCAFGSFQRGALDGSMLGPWISVLVTKEARNLRWNPQHLNDVFFENHFLKSYRTVLRTYGFL